jgi:molybdate transport system substrate-binding protein
VFLILLLLTCGCETKPDRAPAVAASGSNAEGTATRTRTLRIAAASDLKFALDEIVDEFEARTKGADLSVSYGSSGNFFAQLSNKAPFDLFLSADVDYPRKLIEQLSGVPDSEFVYAIGRIVVWVPANSPADFERDGIQALDDAGIRKIAIANPRFAPYGRAAEAAMKSLGVYEKVASKLVLGDTVAQATQFVESGAADAGIIGRAHALSAALREKGRYWEVPPDACPRMEQAGVILPWATDVELAREFREFLIGADGRAILERHGFVLPER